MTVYAYTHVRTVTIEAASGSGGSVGVSISVSGPRGQHKMGPAKRRGVAWRGLAWRAMPCCGVHTLFVFRSDQQRVCVRTCSIYIDVYPVYMAHSVAVAASKRWDCAIGRVSKIEI